MNYRLAEENDIESICEIIKNAKVEMETHGIFQWDKLYPTKEDFLDDIKKEQLYIGEMDDNIAVVYAVNEECDEEYKNGKWNNPDSECRIIHRLCVNPRFQNQGVAKNTLVHIEQKLKAMNVETIRLDVFSQNPFALSLYINSGYKNVGNADWRKGRFYLMEKCLQI